MPKHVAGSDNADRPSVVHDRDVAEAADGHLVDGHRDRLVVAEHDRIASHEIAHVEGVQLDAGDFERGVPFGEDTDQPTGLGTM